MLQNTEGPAAIGHVISTSPSFDTHLSMNAGRLTCVLRFTGPHKQSQLDSWRQPGPNGGSGLLFNILPSEPCRQSTVHFESPSVRLKEHRQWKKLSKKCSAILQLVFSPEALWMKALNESFEWVQISWKNLVIQEVLVFSYYTPLSLTGAEQGHRLHCPGSDSLD